LFKREASSGSLDDYRNTSVRGDDLPLFRAAIDGLFGAEKLDAIVARHRPAGPRCASPIRRPQAYVTAKQVLWIVFVMQPSSRWTSVWASRCRAVAG